MKKTLAEIQGMTKLSLKNFLLEAVQDSFFPHIPQNLADRIRYTVLDKNGQPRNVAKVSQKDLVALAEEWIKEEAIMEEKVEAEKAARAAKEAEAKKPARKRLGKKKEQDAEQEQRKDLINKLTVFVEAQENPSIAPAIREALEPFYKRAKLALERQDKCAVVALQSLYGEIQEAVDTLAHHTEPEQLTLEPKDEPSPAPEPPKKEKKPGKNKLGKKKSDEKKEAVVSVNKADTMFPAEIVDEQLGTLIKVPDKFTTIAELRSYMEEHNYDVDVYFAYWWPEEYIRKYDYVSNFETEQVTKFPLNLDLASLLYVHNKKDVFHAVSAYTEAIYKMKGTDLLPGKSADGDYKVRYTSGCEFEVYIKK